MGDAANWSALHGVGAAISLLLGRARHVVRDSRFAVITPGTELHCSHRHVMAASAGLLIVTGRLPGLCTADC